MLKKDFYKRLIVAILFSTIALTFVSCSENDDEFPGGGRVTDVDLTVDNANFTGTCPHTFVFSGLIETNGAGLITYVWERSTGNGTPQNVNLPVPGGVVIQDSVVLTASGSVTVTMHVTRPNDISSESVTATATCQ
ncbi:hypothetical protein L0156_20465 [bacterium]|nr:hypothetical protein [bacterium]